jgi:DNA polymerase elongation subunit (family B)
MSLETPAFQANPILFGHAQVPRLLAFELAGDAELRVFRRDPDGQVRAALQPFRPFALLASTDLLAGWPGAREVEPLAGQGAYRYLVFFAGWREALDARAHLQRLAPRGEDEAGAPFLFFGDPIQQALTLSGQTHFLELPYAELRRLQVAVAAFCAEGPAPSAARAEDRLTAIALTDSTGWEHDISGRDVSEAEMLADFERLVQERDPDVIEGHGLFRGDLAYLAARAQRHRMKLRLGRGEGPLRGYPGRLQVAERSIAYRRFEVSGRHLLDTWLMAQQYDVTARDLEGYGLREIASHFGLPGADRLPLTPDRAAWCFQHDPAVLVESVREDARETRALGALLGRSYFVQAQIFPFSYQAVALRGNATKIDALLSREYLRRRHAIPAPEPPREVLGGHTEIAYQGVARHVLHYDVTSLYPSVMLAFDCVPARDELRLFAGLLGDLRAFRVEAKRLARAAQTDEARAHFEALQVTFKILINSFYGYLGFPLGHFNDYAVANQVTAKGRELIQAVIAFLAARGAQLVEADTDGLYVVAPPDVRTPEDEERLLAEVSAILPAGISLEMDGRYRAMFSYKMKNYALLDYEGRLSVTGSGFRSRGLELFQRTWMEEMFRHLLEDRPDRIPEVTRRYAEAFRRHQLDVRRFMKTETLQDALPTYREKVRAGKRNPAAAYELALRSGRPYQPGDQVSYYVAGTSKKVKVHEAAKPAAAWDPERPDENVEYYTAKLLELEAKFRPFFDARPAGAQAPSTDGPAPAASLFPEAGAASPKSRRRRAPPQA